MPFGGSIGVVTSSPAAVAVGAAAAVVAAVVAIESGAETTLMAELDASERSESTERDDVVRWCIGGRVAAAVVADADAGSTFLPAAATVAAAGARLSTSILEFRPTGLGSTAPPSFSRSSYTRMLRSELCVATYLPSGSHATPWT